VDHLGRYHAITESSTGVARDEPVHDKYCHAAAKRVPTPKLERQIDQVATLPRAQQQFVSQFPDTVLKQSP
jgi:hypothetical protein